ncbi:MAG: FAD-binding protein, partial [Deltaproteobacteria bacterium]|nr:FAD-binding protein [Deltaproteobacteria bacterium]
MSHRQIAACSVPGNVSRKQGCIVRSIDPSKQLHRRRLCRRDGRVDGVELERGGVPMTVRAGKGVVLASGGFEWNAQMMAEHFPGPVEWTGSPTTNTGD